VNSAIQHSLSVSSRSSFLRYCHPSHAFSIGKVIVHDLPAGRLSAASLKRKRIPPRSRGSTIFATHAAHRSMYLAPGHAYIFFNYGAHFMLNVVSEPAAPPRRSSFRLSSLRWHRRHAAEPQTSGLHDLTRGQAASPRFSIDRRHDGLDLCAPGALWLGVTKHPVGPIGKIRSNRASPAPRSTPPLPKRGNPFVSAAPSACSSSFLPKRKLRLSKRDLAR